VTWTFARVSVIALLAACVMAPLAASAADVRAGPSAFCDAAGNLRQEFQASEGFNTRHKDDVRALRRLVGAAAADAPRALQPSFATALRFYDRILAGEIALVGGTDEARDRYEPAAKRAGRASLVIARYLRNRCGILL
jgi:hypothetical protein